MKNKKGITLVSLVIAIAIMIIIVTIVVVSRKDTDETINLSNLSADIDQLSEKIQMYYLKHGTLPIKGEVITSPEIGETNPNDGENYYEIDISKLDNVTLKRPDEKYIINEQSHQIYTENPVIVDDIEFYTILDNSTGIQQNKEAPGINIGEPSKAYAKQGEVVSYVITTDEPVTLDSSKISLSGEGIEGSTISATGSGTSFLVEVTIGTGSGNIILELGEGTFVKESGELNESANKSGLVADNTPPVGFEITVVVSEDLGSATIKGSTTDLHSGIAGYQISSDNGTTWSEITNETTYTYNDLNGNYYFKMKAIDNVGLETESNTVTASGGCTHTFTAWTETNSSTHSRTCTKCGEVETGNHSFGGWTTVTSASCTSGGSKRRSCTACGCTETQATGSLGHSYTAKTVSATCTSGGYTRYTCSRCGHYYDTNKTSLLGHTYINGKCIRCGRSSGSSSGGGSGSSQTICEQRGYHSNSTYTYVNSSQHRGKCGVSGCGYTWYESHNMVQQQGNRVRICSKCGYEKTY